MAKKTDAEAMDELREWCRPLGFKAVASPWRVSVVWKDPAGDPGEREWTVFAVERRTVHGWESVHPYVRKRQSVASACAKIVKAFKDGKAVLWSRFRRTRVAGLYGVETQETACLELPRAESPSEMALKLAAMGWAGNPFGESAELDAEG